jgi:hypothetical protein
VLAAENELLTFLKNRPLENTKTECTLPLRFVQQQRREGEKKGREGENSKISFINICETIS